MVAFNDLVTNVFFVFAAHMISQLSQIGTLIVVIPPVIIEFFRNVLLIITLNLVRLVQFLFYTTYLTMLTSSFNL